MIDTVRLEFGDVKIGPHRLEKLVLADKLPSALGEMPEHTERLWRQRDAIFAAPEQGVVAVKDEVAEREPAPLSLHLILYARSLHPLDARPTLILRKN